VFLNLTLNAMQAMPNGGTINIGLHSYRDEDEPKKIWVEIIYRDNGIGIAPGLVNKIFHPFYTTKEKGTGLGLSIVHNIVESHNGILEVRSKLGKGTTFCISLPIAKLLK
jgi:signal transduction histidine kinase